MADPVSPGPARLRDHLPPGWRYLEDASNPAQVGLRHPDGLSLRLDLSGGPPDAPDTMEPHQLRAVQGALEEAVALGFRGPCALDFQERPIAPHIPHAFATLRPRGCS